MEGKNSFWRENMCYILGGISFAVMLVPSIVAFDKGAVFIWLLLTTFLLFFLDRIAEHWMANKESYKSQLDKGYIQKGKDLEDAYHKKELKIEEREKKCKWREDWARSIVKENKILGLSALMYADVHKYVFEDAENYLRYKTHPSMRGAEVVKKMREESIKHLRDYRIWQYKIEILKETFPELTRYIEDDSNESVLELSGYDDFNELEKTYDRRYNYLTENERALPEVEKSQIALDRYNMAGKSNWTIGVEYEMYVEYLLRLSGYHTIPNGCLRRLEDLGRDIIATKYVDGNLYTYIIQCKRYGAGKEIHENTICQLYGTTMEYEISNQGLFNKVIPCLYTTAPLSNMAQKFADRLKITIVSLEMGRYPQIKCNIGNNGEKIYHLPFDQQYYNTIIDKPGEFYAWTAREAEDAGFRRAMRHNPYSH